MTVHTDQLDAAGLVWRLDGDVCVITLPDDGSGVVEVSVCTEGGELAFHPARSSLQRAVLALLP